MYTDYLSYQDARIHYHRFGEGKKLLIALHGFGDRAQLFSVLEPALRAHYTVFALDLPFHGLTDWHKKEFTQKDLLAIFRLIQKSSGQEKFDLMAYSFGGRLAISILPQLHSSLEQLYLIAPDGIQTKWMYSVDRVPYRLRLFCFWLLRNPDWFLRFLKTIYRIGLISRFIYDFTAYHISAPERRNRLMGCWLSMSHFYSKPKRVKNFIKQKGIPTHLYFGARDEVIPLSAGQWFDKEVDNIHLHIIEEGHLLVNEKLAQLLVFQLSGNSI